MAIALRPEAIDEVLFTEETLIAPCAIGAVRTRKNLKLLVPPPRSATEPPSRNASLLKLVAQAFVAREAIEAGGAFDDVARRLGYGPEYLADMVRTSYLDPFIISAIVGGHQPDALRRRELVQTTRIPLGWSEQRLLFGVS